MPFRCIICSDSLDGQLPTTSAPCGHVFHETCIKKWLAQSKTCPECRHAVNSRGLKRLFINVETDERRVSNIEKQLNSLGDMNASQTAKINCLTQKATNLQKLIKTGKKKLEETVAALEEQTSAVKGLENKLSRMDSLEKTNSFLVKKIELLRSVDALISTRQNDINVVLEGMADGDNTANNLAAYCVFLKEEFKTASEGLSQIRNQLLNQREMKRAQMIEKDREILSLRAQVHSQYNIIAELMAKFAGYCRSTRPYFAPPTEMEPPVMPPLTTPLEEDKYDPPCEGFPFPKRRRVNFPPPDETTMMSSENVQNPDIPFAAGSSYSAPYIN